MNFKTVTRESKPELKKIQLVKWLHGEVFKPASCTIDSYHSFKLIQEKGYSHQDEYDYIAAKFNVDVKTLKIKK